MRYFGRSLAEIEDTVSFTRERNGLTKKIRSERKALDVYMRFICNFRFDLQTCCVMYKCRSTFIPYLIRLSFWFIYITNFKLHFRI